MATPALAELASALSRKSGIETTVEVNDHAFILKSVAADKADIALTGQPLTQVDRGIFTAFPGRSAVQLPFGYEALSAVVHPDNPLPSITEGQLIALMVDPNCAEAFQPPALLWGELGAEGNWKQEPLSVLIPDAMNPAREALKALVLGACDPRPESTVHPTDTLLERDVAGNIHSLGVVRKTRIGAGVRVLPVVASASVDPVTPSLTSIETGSYPFVRKLWVVMNHRPQPGSPEAAFTAFVQSATGQALVDRLGFYPLPELVEENRLNKGSSHQPGRDESAVNDQYRRSLPKSAPPAVPPSQPE